MGLLTDKNKNIEGFLDMCWACVVGSQFLREQTGQEPVPSYNPQVFMLDLDEDTSFVMNWLMCEIKDRGQEFLGWPHILESTDTLKRLLGSLFKEMGQYVHDYFNYNAMRWVKKGAAVPSARMIADILLDEICGHIAQAYNYLHMQPSCSHTREDFPGSLMDDCRLVSCDHFKNILTMDPDYSVIESTFMNGWPQSKDKGNAEIHFNLSLRPSYRLGTLNPINLVTLIIKYPIEFYGNLDK